MMNLTERQKMTNAALKNSRPNPATNAEPILPNSTAKITFDEPVKFNPTNSGEMMTTGQLASTISSCFKPVLADYYGCTVAPMDRVAPKITIPVYSGPMSNGETGVVEIANPLSNTVNTDIPRSSGITCIMYFAEGAGINPNGIKCLEKFSYDMKGGIVERQQVLSNIYGARAYRLTDDAMSILTPFVERDRKIKDNKTNSFVPNWDIVRTEICQPTIQGNKILMSVRLDILKILSAIYHEKINGELYDYFITLLKPTSRAILNPGALGEYIINVGRLNRKSIQEVHQLTVINPVNPMMANIY